MEKSDLMRIALAKKMNQALSLGSGKADKSVYSAYCSLSCKPFQISNSGFKQVLAHSSEKKHQDLAKGRYGSDWRHFSVKTPIIQDRKTL